MVVAPVAAGRDAALRGLLGAMNRAPGVVDPFNGLVPFGRFERLHFARFVALDDSAMAADWQACGLPPRSFPAYLAFIGDCDGPLQSFFADLSGRAGEGLRKVFACCEDFDRDSDVLSWMLAHNRPASANYVNWIGRTVRQVREESALQQALSTKLRRDPPAADGNPQHIRRELIAFVEAETRAGRLALTPADPTPLGWWIGNLLHAIAVPLAGLVALPFVIVLSPLLLILLRSHETRDREMINRPEGQRLRVLQQLEDHDVTNQFTAMGAVKPGVFRRWTLTILLVGLDYACRHVYNRGYLTRVRTIHFASWAYLDNKSRLVFASNYDGSLEGYMDDFINKVAWGLNLVFSNGLGYPRTDWLVKGGARRELRFKNFLRCHELPTEVWYKAYPGLNAVDIARNQRIREGLERAQPTDAEALAWVRLL